MNRFVELTDTTGKDHFINTAFISHITVNQNGQAVFHVEYGSRNTITCPITIEAAKSIVNRPTL